MFSCFASNFLLCTTASAQGRLGGGGTDSARKITFKMKRKGMGSGLAGFLLIAVITQSATASPGFAGCRGGGCWHRLSPRRLVPRLRWQLALCSCLEQVPSFGFTVQKTVFT